jgi:hypothetical protein
MGVANVVSEDAALWKTKYWKFRARALTDASRELQPRDDLPGDPVFKDCDRIGRAHRQQRKCQIAFRNSRDAIFGESQTSPTLRGWWSLVNSVTGRTLMTGDVSSPSRTGPHGWGANEAIRTRNETFRRVNARRGSKRAGTAIVRRPRQRDRDRRGKVLVQAIVATSPLCPRGIATIALRFLP